jgi:hypothetical protein
MGEHGGDDRFMWFRSLECNTLRIRENGSCITVCCSSVDLVPGVLGSVPQIQWPPCSFIAQGRAVTRRSETRHVAPRWLEQYYNI